MLTGSVLSRAEMSQLSSRLRGCMYGFFIGDAVAMPIYWWLYGNETKRNKPESDEWMATLHARGPRRSMGGRFAPEVAYDTAAGINSINASFGKDRLGKRVSRDIWGAMSQCQDGSVPIPIGHMSEDAVVARAAMKNWPKLSTFHKELPLGRPAANAELPLMLSTDALRELSIVPAVVVYGAASGQSLDNIIKQASAAVSLCNRSSIAPTDHFVKLLHMVLHGASLTEAAEQVAQVAGVDARANPWYQTGEMNLNLYQDSTLPSLLQMCYHLGHDVDQSAENGKMAQRAVESALLASANAGEENVARGALLGSLIGARAGIEVFAKGGRMRSGLADSESLMKEIKSFVARGTASHAGKPEKRKYKPRKKEVES